MIYVMQLASTRRWCSASPVPLCCGLRHRSTFYDNNPTYTGRPARAARAGYSDFWDFLGAGHGLELNNLKSITHFSHRNELPVTPAWMRLHSWTQPHR